MLLEDAIHRLMIELFCCKIRQKFSTENLVEEYGKEKTLG